MDNENRLLLGTKFYCFDENNKRSLLRVLSYQSSDSVIVLSEDNDKYKVNIDFLLENYTKLIPDGTLSIANVLTDNIEDVIITFAKTFDILNGINTPTIICRQNFLDIFDFTATDERRLVGFCATPISMPKETSYESLFRCDKVMDSIFINTYIDDELSDILQCFKPKKYNNVLERLFEDALKRSKVTSLVERNARSNGFFMGYTNNIHDLLNTNGFMEEYYLAFGIIKLNTPIIPIHLQLNPYDLDFIEKLLGIHFDQHSIVQYGKDIDLSRFNEDNYILVKDINNVMYIITFTSDTTIDYNKIDFNLLYRNRPHQKR